MNLQRIERRIIRLLARVNPRARLPRHFDLWSPTMQIGWLRQHQVRKCKKCNKKAGACGFCVGHCPAVIRQK